MNGHHDIAYPFFTAAFSPHLESRLSFFLHLFLVLSPLRRHAWPSVQLPPATREPANLRPTQPTSSTPADVREWTLGWRGHGGRAEWHNRAPKKKGLEKAIGLGYYIWADIEKICVCVWERETAVECMCVLLFTVASSNKTDNSSKRQHTWSIKHPNHNYTEPDVMSFNSLFCLTSNPKP